jgi:hypothetical protein
MTGLAIALLVILGALSFAIATIFNIHLVISFAIVMFFAAAIALEIS